MDIDPKYISLVIPIFIICSGLWYKVKRSDERIKTVEKVVFIEKGGLNIVSNDVCSERRNNINASITREANTTAKALEQLACLNENVIIIMTHMNLEPKRIKPKTTPISVYKDIIG